MVRKKAGTSKKPNPFAPSGKLLMIEKNRSLNSAVKSPKLIQASPQISTSSPRKTIHEKSPNSTDITKSTVKKRKAKSGLRALSEIKKFQANTGLLIPKAPFSRLVREILQNCFGKTDFRFTEMGLTALHEATEMAIVNLLEIANLCCIHAKRVTLLPSDIRLTRRAFGVSHPLND